VAEVRRFETDLLAWFEGRHAALLDQIRETGQLPDEEQLRRAVEEFKLTFVATISVDGERRPTEV
jgi:F-type H+-transporting ATPase subunit alpha